MKSAQILKQKIASQELTIGVISTFHLWPGLVEIIMRSGLDYMIIDLEHLTFDAEMVAEACAIGRRANFPILIRPPAAEIDARRRPSHDGGRNRRRERRSGHDAKRNS